MNSILRVAVLIFSVWLGLCLLLFLLQKFLIFQSFGSTFGNCSEAKSYSFVAVEQNEVRFYHRQQAGAEGSLIYFHGNAGSACDRLFFSEVLEGLPLNLIFLEYPGYGGEPRRKASQEAFLRAGLEVFDLIESESPGPIFLFGESIGSSVAVWVAAQRIQSAGLILQAPAASLVDIARRHYPWLPVKLLLRHPFPSIDWAPRVQAPSLVLFSETDEVVPPSSSKRLAAQLPHLKKLVAFKSMGHNQFLLQETYQEQIRSFLKQELENHQ
ncbi:MAG: hypothetical protein EA369_06425 [Bradymonadales bacterium]|nr:MAG: hypothetical protein EA369_06425 [Bradymonadales bacterium]